MMEIQEIEKLLSALPIPPDLPEDWAYDQIVAPNGLAAGLTEQHGYNYLMEKVNAIARALKVPVIPLTRELYDTLTAGQKKSALFIIIDEDESNVTSFNKRTGDVMPESGDYTAVQITFAPGSTGMVSKDVQKAIEELFTSVSDGKKLVASAITDKGVPTAPDATFQTMSDNIRKISTIPKDVFTITLTASPAAGGTVSGGGYASKNMKVQVDASPADGYTFGGWTKNGTSVSSKESYLFQVTGNTALTAVFEEEQLLKWASAILPVSALWRGIVYGNGKYVAIGSNGEVAVGDDTARNWTASTLPVQDVGWAGIAYGNGKFVAVGNGGRVAYSVDGINWLSGNISATANLYSVTYGMGKFVAVGIGRTGGSSPAAAYTTDGINWTRVELPAYASVDYWTGVAYGEGLFVAVLQNSPYASYSEDGVNWGSFCYLGASAYWTDLSYGNGLFAAVGNKGVAYANAELVKSHNNWESGKGISTGTYLECIAYGNKLFVTFSGSRPHYSLDGETWEIAPSIGATSLSLVQAITFGNGKFVAVGDASGSAPTNEIVYSIS